VDASICGSPFFFCQGRLMKASSSSALFLGREPEFFSPFFSLPLRPCAIPLLSFAKKDRVREPPFSLPLETSRGRERVYFVPFSLLLPPQPVTEDVECFLFFFFRDTRRVNRARYLSLMGSFPPPFPPLERNELSASSWRSSSVTSLRTRSQ